MGWVQLRQPWPRPRLGSRAGGPEAVSQWVGVWFWRSEAETRLSGWGGATISSQGCGMPRLADPSTPTLPPSPPIGILGEAPMQHHGDGLHRGLDPHLRQPHQPSRAPAARQGRGGQHKKEQAWWATPCTSWRDWAGGPPCALDRSAFPRSSLEPREPGLAKEAALAEIRGG